MGCGNSSVTPKQAGEIPPATGPTQPQQATDSAANSPPGTAPQPSPQVLASSSGAPSAPASEPSVTWVGDHPTAVWSLGDDATPWGITADPSNAGLVFVSDLVNNRILVYSDKDGSQRQTFGEEGHADGQLQQPSGIAVHSSHVYVLDTGNFRVQVFTAEGKFVRAFGNKGEVPGEFGKDLRPAFIALSPSGQHLLVPHTTIGFVCIYDATTGAYLTRFASDGSATGPGFDQPLGVATVPVSGSTDAYYAIVTDSSHRVHSVRINDVKESTRTVHAFGKERREPANDDGHSSETKKSPKERDDLDFPTGVVAIRHRHHSGGGEAKKEVAMCFVTDSYNARVLSLHIGDDGQLSWAREWRWRPSTAPDDLCERYGVALCGLQNSSARLLIADYGAHQIASFKADLI